MSTSIPLDLVFDDEPLEGILYGSEVPKATPADILECFCRGDDLPPESLNAVVAILAQSPEKGSSLEDRQRVIIMDYVEQSLAAEKEENPRGLLKLASICHAAGILERAESTYRQALDCRDGVQQLTGEERRKAVDNLADLLEQLDRYDDAWAERKLCQGEMLLADGNSFPAVRSLALDLFVEGRYQAAEQLYRSLLARGFEQPGTLIHLARVLLMQDRLPEARKAIAEAWKLARNKGIRQETPCYVLHRISFFRILCAMLTRGDYSRPVAGLKRELLENSSRETWSIGPVIEHLKPYLRPVDLDFLEAIVEALGTADSTARLNAFPVWRSEYVCNDSVECSLKITSGR